MGCWQETKYDLPDILLAYLTPVLFTTLTHPCRDGKPQTFSQRTFRNRNIEFSRVEDFGSISRTQPCIYNLASVVYYNEGTPASGHYTASTWRNGVTCEKMIGVAHLRSFQVQYVHDDTYCDTITKGDSRLAGRPYFAIYYNAATSHKSNVQSALPTVTELE